MYIDGNSIVTDANGYLTTTGVNDFVIGTNNTARIHVDGGGNVGIGNTSPSNRFHVTGPDASVGTIKWQNAGSRKAGFLYSDSVGVAIYSTSFNNASIYLAENDRIAFKVNGSTERMRIDSSGNVGIGTTSPSYKLHVAGDIGIDNGDSIYVGNAASTISSNSSADILYFANRDHVFGSVIGGVSNERVRITEVGNVGIGTTSPGAKLEVAGAVKIAGNFAKLFFEDTAGSDLDAYIANNANGLFFGKTNSPSSSNDVLMLDLTNKRVGIGTSTCLLYTSPSPRDGLLSRMPSSA